MRSINGLDIARAKGGIWVCGLIANWLAADVWAKGFIPKQCEMCVEYLTLVLYLTTQKIFAHTKALYIMALNFDEFQKVVETAQQADAVKADLKRTLRKVTSALTVLQAALGEVETVLSDEYVSTPKTRKPRTPRAPKAEGEPGDAPAKKPGRPKKTA